MFRSIFNLAMVGAGISIAVLLSGCQNLRLYSEVRDKQGIAAQDAWKAVDLSAVISTERANLKKLLQAELDTQDRLAAGIRNHELRYMVEAATLKEGLVDAVNARLKTVAGGAEAVQASRTRLGQYRRSAINFAAAEEEFKAKGLAMPGCTAVTNGAEPPAIGQWRKSADSISIIEIDGTLAQLRKLCASTLGDMDVYAGLGGEIGAARAQYLADVDALATIKTRAGQLRVDYQVALTAYNAAVASASTKADTAEQVKAALGKLSRAVSALEAAQDAFSLQFLSKERLDSLEKFNSAVTQATSDGKVPDGASEAAAAFILLPGLIDDAKTSLAAAKKPLALPLVIRRNQEQLKLEAATREIDARETVVRLSKELLEALYGQAVQLWLASVALSQDGSEKSPNVMALYGSSMADAFSKTNRDEKEAIYRAAALYLDAVNRLTARRYKLEYMRVAASHELSLAYAEVNVKQWESLIGTTVEQVAAYGASGIKAENVAALLNTLGVLYIGHGVNK